MISKNWLIISAILLALPMVNAQVTIGNSVVVNTSLSNTSVIFNITTSLTKLEVNSNSILMNDTGYQNGELVVNITTQELNLTDINTALKTSEFPHLTFSNDTNKNISSNISQTLNITVRVNTASCNIDNVTYLSNTTTFFRVYNQTDFARWVCDASQATFNITGLEQASSSNDLFFTYLVSVVGKVFKIFPNDPPSVPHVELKKRLKFA